MTDYTSETVTETPSEALVIATLGAEAKAAAPTELVPADVTAGPVMLFRVPNDYRTEIVDTEKWGPVRRRSQGTVIVRNARSFIEYVEPFRESDALELFADGNRVTAVFNHDSGQGWNDHRCVYELKLTPSWTGWTGNAGRLMSQESFGEWLEENALDVLQPSSGELLETVLNLRGKVDVTFDSSKVLTNGSVQMLYREDITAAGGKAGTMEVPTSFKLALKVFEGGQRFIVPALLRWRMNAGHVQWMWKFASDVTAIFEESFESELETIETALKVMVLRGKCD